MKLVAFGDSNTRYWLGEEALPGPLEHAWPAQLEQLLRREKKLALSVVNEGWPGAGMAFAGQRFASLTGGADAVILAFGTNDIKLPQATLGEYLHDLDNILTQNGARPILVLSILWFARGYGFSGSQDRLKFWNQAAAALCQRRDVSFWDTTAQFAGQLSLYNDHPAHHLNAQGQLLLAQCVYQGLSACSIV